jgi:hypothetical protein
VAKLEAVALKRWKNKMYNETLPVYVQATKRVHELLNKAEEEDKKYTSESAIFHWQFQTRPKSGIVFTIPGMS